MNYIDRLIFTKAGADEIFKELMQTLQDNPNRGLRIRVSVLSENKSNKQRRYLFGVVYQTALVHMKEDGHDEYTTKDVHEFFKQKFLQYYNNEGELKTRSTKDMKMLETMEYINKIINWCAEQGWEIPEPPEDITIKNRVSMNISNEDEFLNIESKIKNQETKNQETENQETKNQETKNQEIKNV